MTTCTRLLLLTASVVTSSVAFGSEPGQWPLPDAPVRLVIPDVPAFDAALTGPFRGALRGLPNEDDRLVTAWRQSQVGSKLEAQWQRFSADLPWTWDEILGLKARSLALALFDVGHLEAVLAIETPLAKIPVSPAQGQPGMHAGSPYHTVSRGAADGTDDPDRRMGLAWAQHGSFLLIATSERAIKLSLEAASRSERYTPPLEGLVALDLDLDALRRDRYFRREFLFTESIPPQTTRVRAALRRENGHFVEVREADGPAGATAHTFPSEGAVAAAWEPDTSTIARVLRAGVLEPLPNLPERPRPALVDLPAATRDAPPDRYMVNLGRPRTTQGGPAFEEAELEEWRALFEKHPIEGWGYAVMADGSRRLVLRWPSSLDGELRRLCLATLTRRAPGVRVLSHDKRDDYTVGPDLPTLTVERTGDYVWLVAPGIGPALLPTPTPSPGLTRWARVDIAAVRAESGRWESAEGPAYPESTRPLSDRVLGILKWIPNVTSLSVERRSTSDGWTETVTFGGTAASSTPRLQQSR